MNPSSRFHVVMPGRDRCPGRHIRHLLLSISDTGEAPWSSGRALALDAARVQSPGWEARIIRCKNLALYIGDCESLVTG